MTIFMISINMHVYVTVSVGHMSAGTYGAQKTLSDHSELELHVVLRHPRWVLTSYSGSLREQEVPLTPGPSLWHLGWWFYTPQISPPKLTKFKAYSNLLFKKIQVSWVIKMTQRVKALPAKCPEFKAQQPQVEENLTPTCPLIFSGNLHAWEHAGM